MAEVLAKTVKEKEATLGFTLEAADIADLEQILRAKYCGKTGLYANMEGGMCREGAITATCFDAGSASSFRASNINNFGVDSCK